MGIKHSHRFAVLLVAATLIACATPPSEDFDAANPLNGMSEPEVVASGFVSTEGPVWHKDRGELLFSDIPESTIYSLEVETGELRQLRHPSDNANGLALDSDGYLLAAEQQTRQITRMNLETGEVSPFISAVSLGGRQSAFNSPNDMALHSNGNIYFTDPPFGIRGRESERELDFNGVFLRKPGGLINLLKAFDIGENPNGIIFSPDETRLYVGVSHDESGPILLFDVDEAGNLSNEREFARARNADGMAVDRDGNLYVATRLGVRVWSEDGTEWGMIRLPGNSRTTNVAFGGQNMSTLYVTSRSNFIYAIELQAKGIE